MVLVGGWTTAHRGASVAKHISSRFLAILLLLLAAASIYPFFLREALFTFRCLCFSLFSPHRWGAQYTITVRGTQIFLQPPHHHHHKPVVTKAQTLFTLALRNWIKEARFPTNNPQPGKKAPQPLMWFICSARLLCVCVCPVFWLIGGCFRCGSVSKCEDLCRCVCVCWGGGRYGGSSASPPCSTLLASLQCCLV